MDPIFSDKFTQRLAESVAGNEQKFQASMVAEIEKTVKSVKVLINKYNQEFDLLKEVMTKSVAEKINEVREEERKKAQDALIKQAMDHQAALKNKDLALKQAEDKHSAAIKTKENALKQLEASLQVEAKKAAEKEDELQTKISS